MFKKLLHRVVVVWCLYGLVRLCILVNPLLFMLCRISGLKWNSDTAMDITEPGHVLGVWVAFALTAGLLFLLGAAVHAFSNWFFSKQ